MRPLPTLILILALTPTAVADEWPQWMGPNRDAIWAETDIIDRLGPEGPKVLWRTAVGGGYAGPAVAQRVRGTEPLWKMLEPTGTAFGRDVVWSHPAFANRCIYCRNDKELICVSLAK